jgi:phospholipid/cholesterol/gamma-HCH transport system ATP-binding protein
MHASTDPHADKAAAPTVHVEQLEMAFGSKLVQRGLNFEVKPGEVFVIMGGSGCGKSTLLRCMIGLQQPSKGQVRYGDDDIHAADAAKLARLRQLFGVAFQQGALWSSMTVGENVMLPMELCADTEPAEREQRARELLGRVGLAEHFDKEPAALSGGMRKRAAIARALALSPSLLYLDEPSAGLDPLSAAHLDELILQLRDQSGATVVLVTHELESIFAVADRALFLDAETKTMIALDAPKTLLAQGPPKVREFLRRGRPEGLPS